MKTLPGQVDHRLYATKRHLQFRGLGGNSRCFHFDRQSPSRA
jgi:hypothetical protein